MIVLTLFVIVCVSFIWWNLTKKPERFPPGPYRWPLVGNLLEFKKGGRKPHEVAADLCSRYGNVVGLYLASKPVVIVSGLNEVREILGRPECQGRPPGAVREYNNDMTGILLTQGDTWKEQRRFTLHHLRDLGVGRRELETLIEEEVTDMFLHAKQLAGSNFETPVPVMNLVNSTGANVVYHLLAGERFKRGGQELQRLLDLIKTATTVNDASGGLANSFPFLLKYARWLTEYDKLMASRLAVKAFLREMVKNHEMSNIEDDTSNFVNLYLREMKKETRGASFNMDQLMTVLYDLFIAGSDTTVSLLVIAILYLIREPKIQAKIHAEMDAVVGFDRLPNVDDRQRLPYFSAMINESLRMANTVVLSVPHAATEEFVFRGYTIPKDARVIVNLFDVHTSKAIWGDPEVFRPERFLDQQGSLINHDALLAFGMGKRVCIGESMARTNIFLTLSALLHKFYLSVPEGDKTPVLDQIGGFVMTQKPFNLKLTPREM